MTSTLKTVIPECWRFAEIYNNTYVYTSTENDKEIRILIAATPINHTQMKNIRAQLRIKLGNFLASETEHISKNDNTIHTFTGKNGSGDYIIITDNRWHEGCNGYPTIFRCFYVADDVFLDVDVLCYSKSSLTITKAYQMLKNI